MQAVSTGFVQGIFLKQKSDISSFPEGEEVSTIDGNCIKFEHLYPVETKIIDEDTVRNRLQRELTLVPGIGETRAAYLRNHGITTLGELSSTRFKEMGEMMSEIIYEESPKEIALIFQDLHRGNDPLLLGFAGQNHASHLFFDIETLGMAHSPIILFGCGEYTPDGLKVTQYLARNVSEELPALILAAKHFKSDTNVVSYNGKVFDIPYLNDRLAYYGEKGVKPRLHFDLLFTTRRMFGKSLPDCCLGTVEDYILNIPRHEDLPGYLVPEYYQRWLGNHDADLIRPIVKHNEADVANLAALLNHQIGIVYGN